MLIESQGKLGKSQGKVREKSGNFRHLWLWQPCLYFIHGIYLRLHRVLTLTWPELIILSYILFPDLIGNSPYCLPYNYQDASLNDLVLD